MKINLDSKIESDESNSKLKQIGQFIAKNILEIIIICGSVVFYGIFVKDADLNNNDAYGVLNYLN